LPETDDETKFAVERFYAEQIDASYPEVYNMLVNPDVERISEAQRHKILNVTLSLYLSI